MEASRVTGRYGDGEYDVRLTPSCLPQVASENLVELETYLQAERHENRKMWDPARRQVGSPSTS